MTPFNCDLIVIGAGAAGLMAGIQAAQRGLSVIILEKMDRPGRKILITGKGRCNVTNCCTVEEFMPNVTTNSRFLYSSLSNCSPYEIMGFFEELGVPLKVERGQRVFPQSDKAGDIAAALSGRAKALGCTIRCGAPVASLLLEEGRAAGVKMADGQTCRAPNVLVATGGKSYPGTGSTGDGYALARQAGHTVTRLKPSLVPIVCHDSCCADLMGLSLKNVTLTVMDTKTNKQVFSELGEMLFTHFGVSGPLVLSASCSMGGDLSRYKLLVDMKPGLSPQQLDARLLRDFTQFQNKAFINSLSLLLPRKMIPVVVSRCGIPGETKVNQITREQRQRLGETIKAFPLAPKCFRPIEEAVVTSGGVEVKEVSPKTMESKKVPGLYFAGEVLDVAGYTGGFNLQIAFSTGFAAGNAVGKP